MTPSSPGPRAVPSPWFVLAVFAAVLLTMAAVQVSVAHRWHTERPATVNDYYAPNNNKESP